MFCNIRRLRFLSIKFFLFNFKGYKYQENMTPFMTASNQWLYTVLQEFETTSQVAASNA